MKKPIIHKQPLPDFIKKDEFFLTYPSNKMTLFQTIKPIYVLKGEYAHSNYEFILTQTSVMNFVLGGKIMDVPPNRIFAINSDQMHGTHFLLADVSFLSIQFEKEFIQELAYNIYGIREISFLNHPIPCNRELKDLIDVYINEHKQKQKGYSFLLDSLSIQIAIFLLRTIGFENSLAEQKEESINVNQIIEFFQANCEETFSLEKISDMSNMSKFNFIRKFKESTGMTPYHYFMNIRIMKALECLNRPEIKIIDVAVMCGFRNHSHFSRVFKMRTGLSPSEYREKVLNL